MGSWVFACSGWWEGGVLSDAHTGLRGIAPDIMQPSSEVPMKNNNRYHLLQCMKPWHGLHSISQSLTPSPARVSHQKSRASPASGAAPRTPESLQYQESSAAWPWFLTDAWVMVASGNTVWPPLDGCLCIKQGADHLS